MKYENLRQLLCNSFCREIGFKEYRDGAIISLPIYDRDGDAFSIYVSEITGGWRLSDGASTIMRLSYENDVDSLLKGSRLELFNAYVDEAGSEYDDGELIKNVPADQLMLGLFEFTKLLGRISDIALLKLHRTSSTFKEQVRDTLMSLLDKSIVHENYIVPNIPNAQDYTIDYKVDAETPLFIFAANNKESVRLSIITMQYLEKHNVDFNSMVILEDMAKISNQDLNRLLIAANDVIPDFHQTDVIGRKINHRIPA
ncbi:DUF1828 domain-containing protein [Acinetobacter ursingii]|uniref:DUF1828 domain-containing protein n=1 Tax=Acinetobacter ursingii TaxID=108980 RepID=UPI0021CD9AC8|nr:DUF1828 domain-containing protein [Acinetobacter ursingii]MCU4589087.1 DUF1828 domain-containing protein [Acinetobacter ursingii]